MECWGLTIDLVSCIGLELAAGLCVDYAAHVGHTFLVTGPGTRSERALETMQHIGPAVMYGGGSTLLAVSMLANSEAYTFQCFFKVNLVFIFHLLKIDQITNEAVRFHRYSYWSFYSVSFSD